MLRRVPKCCCGCFDLLFDETLDAWSQWCTRPLRLVPCWFLRVQIACSSAPRTKSASMSVFMVVLVDQPTMRREKRSSTNAVQQNPDQVRT